MSDNKFSENMVVCAVGILSPGNISDSCESCPHNKSSFPGVLIAGVTKDAVMLLSAKVEIVPEGTKAQVAELEASNAALLAALDDLIDECGQAEDCGLIDWEVMGKAREEAHKARGLQQ